MLRQPIAPSLTLRQPIAPSLTLRQPIALSLMVRQPIAPPGMRLQRLPRPMARNPPQADLIPDEGRSSRSSGAFAADGSGQSPRRRRPARPHDAFRRCLLAVRGGPGGGRGKTLSPGDHRSRHGLRPGCRPARSDSAGNRAGLRRRADLLRWRVAKSIFWATSSATTTRPCLRPCAGFVSAGRSECGPWLSRCGRRAWFSIWTCLTPGFPVLRWGGGTPHFTCADGSGEQRARGLSPVPGR